MATEQMKVLQSNKSLRKVSLIAFKELRTHTKIKEVTRSCQIHTWQSPWASMLTYFHLSPSSVTSFFSFSFIFFKASWWLSTNNCLFHSSITPFVNQFSPIYFIEGRPRVDQLASCRFLCSYYSLPTLNRTVWSLQVYVWGKNTKMLIKIIYFFCFVIQAE